jgi:glucose-1-phosphate thymidylyltransferase
LRLGQQITGRVAIGEASIIENCILGGVSILNDCHITNTFFGPFTSIGAGTRIKNSSIEHSVILNNCFISNIDKLSDSIIGKNANISKQEGTLKTIILFLGDDTKVIL